MLVASHNMASAMLARVGNVVSRVLEKCISSFGQVVPRVMFFCRRCDPATVLNPKPFSVSWVVYTEALSKEAAANPNPKPERL